MQFDFSRWEIVSLFLLPALINFLIFFYSFLILERTRTTTLFSIFVLLVGLWQLSDGFLKLSLDEETAAKWNNVGGIFVLLFLPVGISFLLSLAGWANYRFKKALSLLIFGPAAIFAILLQLDLTEYRVLRSENMYWITNPVPTPLTSLVFSWVGFLAVVMLTLFWVHFLKSRSMQSLLLAAGLTGPVAFGVIFEIVLPLIYNSDAVQLTTPLLSIFSVTALIAIKKYKMLDFSPQHQWSQIVATLNDAILIADNDDKIQYANQAFCNLLGYEFKELEGQTAYELLVVDSHKGIVKDAIE
ncbi:MAG: domain S-box, partial [Bacteroidetes bacterium]|nr:domain S-box [Bacteroidota bacterium]